MKTNRKNKLFQILSETDRSIPTGTLAGMLGLSERTVRNYVKELNTDGNVTILSSRDGYRLQKGTYDKQSTASENEKRVWRVLSDLLTSKDGLNAFDEAESLFVSASTITNTIIPQIKKMVKEYDLRVESHNYQYFLRGIEQNKRKLIGHIAKGDSYGFFNSKNALEQLFPRWNIENIMQELYKTCLDAKLFLNDFALNNLLVHILIILIRIESDNDLEGKEHFSPPEELLSTFPNKKQISTLAEMISSNFEQEYNIKIPECDYRQIEILIAISVEHEMVDIQSVLTQEFINNVSSLLSLVSNRYCTQEFNSDVTLQFSLHMYYARQRCMYQISYPNPIAARFKRDYAPVYDMAVCFAHQFGEIYHIELDEDEISFIAFHFGAFLENNKHNGEHISCVVVVESYHAFSQKLISDINANFYDCLIIIDVLPFNRYLQRQPESELIITTLPLDKTDRPTVLVNPILTRQNKNMIRTEIEEISARRELIHARVFLHSLFHKELYFRNVTLSSVNDYIRFMGRQCLDGDYVNEDFIQDVLLRESVSCTAFTEMLAVPHAISKYADRSFICVVHNDMPIQWNHKMIHFILMIGITEQDMKYFKAAFNLIIELFHSTSRTLDLLKADTFEEFCEQMK